MPGDVALFGLVVLVAALRLLRVAIASGGNERPREAPPPCEPGLCPAPRAPAPPAAPPRTAALSGRARVIDGDTIEVTAADDGTTIRVRLQGIDAPEIGQAEGEEARVMLRKIMRSGECAVEPRGGDVYGRLVARVRRADGKDVGLCMIAAGLAIALPPCPKVYGQVEAQARREARGAWSQNGFDRPSDWRKANPRVSSV